jgi:hypothetical protein
MKLKVIILFAAALTAPLALAEGPLKGVKMDVMGPVEGKLKRRIKVPVRHIITRHMIENGALTEEELAASREEGKELRQSFRDARQAGDEEQARQIREQIAARKVEMKNSRQTYIESNSDLRASLDEMRSTLRDKKRAKREERGMPPRPDQESLSDDVTVVND